MEVVVSSVETVVVGFGVCSVARWTAVIMRATMVVTEVMKERVNNAIIIRRLFMFSNSEYRIRVTCSISSGVTPSKLISGLLIST